MSKITKSARGEDCLIRIPGVCNGNPETVVLCHDNGRHGGPKNDIEAAYGCSDCHDCVDFRVQNTQWHRDEIISMFRDGQRRTRAKLVEKGLIIIA